MNRILQLILVIVLTSATYSVAQKRMKAPVIICPADYTHTDFHVPPPAKFLENVRNARSNASVQTATIIVNYYGFDEEQEAKDAFQFAVDIWSTLIKSDVPIYLDATYRELGSGVLGSAGTTGLYKGFEGAPNDSTWYNVALAEKIAGHALNKPGEADISASFSNTFNWYLGTDGNTGSGQHDFVTVVLHEIGHGLGFFALNGYDDTDNTGSRAPGVYDNYIENGDGLKIFDVPDNSVELGDYFTSNSLFLNAPLAVTANNNTPPKIYAPASYNGGSSISHWDENTFNGTDDALLTPQIGAGESIHDPGPNMMSLFANMGWVHTSLKHKPDLIIDNLVDNILVSVEVTSDTTLSVEQPKLHYSFDGFNSQTDELMINDGNGMYSFAISNPGSTSILEYYITGVSDVLGRDYASPSVFSERHRTIIQNMPSTSVPYSLADGGNFEGPSEFIQISLKGDIDIWEQGVPSNILTTPSSGTEVWKTDLNSNILKPNADYTTALITPKFDLSDTTADYTLKFDLSMDVEIDSAIAGLSVAYSIDGGLTWLDLGQPNDGRGENWMNKSDEYLLFESGNGWVLDNTADAPQEVSYNLSEIIADGEAEVYFALVASVTNAYGDDIYVFDGIMIDDFEITKTEPRAFFDVAASSINFPGQNVQFNYISKGAQTFSWDFGDGEFSSAKNPVHAYQNGGVYDVTLTITYPGGVGIHSFTEVALIYVLEKKGANYSLAEGGDMESNFDDFLVDNIKGTPFELGMSSITGKSGTASGVNAWVSGINDAEYENQSEAFLYTPIFDFSLLGGYELSFKANYSLEEAWDAFILEYTVDNGASWQQLKPEVAEGWYDVIGEDNVAQGWPAIPLFSGNTNDSFVTKSVDLTDFGGLGDVSFRFHFKTDFAALDVGMVLDDFVLTGPQEAAIADFTYEGNTGCDGQIVTFTNASTGSISSINWNFGANSSPSTGVGAGPFEVTYSGTGTSTVSLVLVSPENGTQVATMTDIISTAPLHLPTYVSEAVVGNDGQLNLVASNGDAFQWYINTDSITGATQQAYLAVKSGSYAVSVDVGGCIATSESNAIITALIDGEFGKSISIYPNPASGKLNVAFSHSYKGKVRLKIYNSNGQIFFTSLEDNSVRGIQKEIDVTNFSHGIYFVELQFGDKRVIRELLIE